MASASSSKRRFPHTLAVRHILPVILLAACPGCDRQARDNTSANPETGKTEVTLFIWESSYERVFYETALSNFARLHPEIKVRKIASGTSDYWIKLQTMMAGSSPPDVFLTNRGPTSGLAVYAKNGVLLDLNRFIERDGFDLSDFFPSAVDHYRYLGGLYALPLVASNLALYYNIDMFDRAGLDYPDPNWTWDDYLYAAHELTVRDDKGRVIQYGCGMSGNRLWPFVYQNEGKRVGDDGRRWLLTDPSHIDRNAEALQFYCDLWLKYNVAPIPYSKGVGRHFSFRANSVAMDISGPWEFMTLADAPLGFRWAVAELPQGRCKATELSTMAYAISSLSKHQAAAWQLVSYLCSPEVQTLLATSGRDMPSRRSIANSEAFRRGKTRFGWVDRMPFVHQLQYVAGATSPNPSEDAIMRELFEIQFENVKIGKTTARDFLLSLARQIEGHHVLDGMLLD